MSRNRNNNVRPPLTQSTVTEDENEGPDSPDHPTPTRKPFGSQDQKMAYPEREGYHRHWFNDSPGRIYRATEAGYTHVIGHDEEKVSLVVGSKEGGGPLLAYLMEVPQEWWEEDRKSTQKITDDTLNAIERGKSTNPQDGQYIPAQGISIRQGR